MKNQVHQIIRILALALLAHYTLCWPLWLEGGSRTFPCLPVSDFISPLPVWAGRLSAILVVLLTVTLFVFPQKKIGLATLLLLLTLLIALDLNRLQAWTYFYMLSFSIILVAHKQEEVMLEALRWLLAAVYAWGGFNKLTPYFAVDNFPWFCEAFVWTKPLGAFPGLGYAVALVEFLFAAGLIWRWSRPVFRWVVPGFHLFIALALSPFGLDWNAVVIPWNIAMGAMVWVLFDPGKSASNSFFSIFKNTKPLVGSALAIPLTLAWVLPVFNIFHCWDEALSWKMYSNTQTEANFYSPKPVLEPVLRKIWERHAFNQGTTILLDDWAFENLQVPAYNSRRTHLQIARYLCGRTQGAAETGLLLFSVARWDRSAERWEQIPCAAIKP